MATLAVKRESNRDSATNGELKLSTGFFQRFFECDGITAECPILQVLLAKKLTKGSVGYPESCLRMRLSDGAFYYSGVFLPKQLEKQSTHDSFVGNGENGGEIIAVKKLRIESDCWIGRKSDVNPGIPMLVISSYELLSRGHPVLSKGISHDGNKDVFANFSPLQSYSVPWKKTFVDNNYDFLAPLQETVSMDPLPVSAGDVKITPITLITPYVSKWRICGICTSRDELKTIKSPRVGDLLVFSFVITDKDGVAIRISSFSDAAKSASMKVQLSCSYYISNCLVKQANKRFNTTGHDYELTVNANTEPPLVLKICPLVNVPGHKGEYIDVLAVVDQIDPVNKFISRQGRECVKRDLHLIDQSVVVVQLTLWGDQAEHFDDDLLGQVISIKGALVKEWNGTFSLAVSSASKIEFNPEFEGVQALIDWYINKRKVEDVRSISMATTGGGNVFASDTCFIGTVTALQLGNEAALPNGRYMNLKAMVTSVKTNAALYRSCTNKGCSKKVVQLEGGQFSCVKCDMLIDGFRWAYMVQVELTDFSGSLWVTIFSNVATKLFGIDAQKLGEMKDTDAEAYERVLRNICFKYFNWKINAKTNIYNEETRMRYSVLACNDVSYERYIPLLEVSLEALEIL